MKSFPNGFIENETIYRNAWGEHPARIIGIVKNVDFSIAYFKHFKHYIKVLKKNNYLYLHHSLTTKKSNEKIFHPFIFHIHRNSDELSKSKSNNKTSKIC